MKSILTSGTFDQFGDRIEELPMKDVQKAVEGVKNNKARYRYVLTQDIDSA